MHSNNIDVKTFIAISMNIINQKLYGNSKLINLLINLLFNINMMKTGSGWVRCEREQCNKTVIEISC